ncbi:MULTISPECIES: O-methyltransferase [Clostridium]|uniref:O-methyltransferase n=1 Tax=Clostridium TaxID=1485 RepID=UPI0008260B92|nr:MULTISPECIES: O-methyltransferase [Clostridium]PJI08762.1 O-methyltransferase [Clostridium sp. CT7]
MDFDKANLYIEDLYKNQDKITKEEFISKTKLKKFIPVIDDDTARFLKLIITALRPKRILEIGTSIGYSTTSMAEMVNEYGGKITTIEYDEKVAEQAKLNFKNAGVSQCIELKFGDALKIIPELHEEYDLIFQDVDKRLYPVLFESCVRILKKGGILIADDALFPVLDLDEKWKNLTEPMKEFNKLVADSDEVYSTLLPIGDGIIAAVKK